MSASFLTVFHAIHHFPIPYKLRDPPDCHHALFGVCKLLMVSHQMLLVPRILLHLLVIIRAFEHNLAEAVKVCQVGHLVVKEPAHEGARLDCVVDLIKLAAAKE